MNIEELAVIKIEAEGYYSNSYIRCEAVVEKSFIEKYVEDFNSVYFHELDGKHSEIEGDVTILNLNKENLADVIKSYLDAEGDEYKIWECLVYDIDEDVITRQIEVNTEFCDLCDMETATKYFFKGEEL